MVTGEIRSQIDRIWDTFWSGGISNPLEVIEQITYLLFLKRLDEQETAEELKANQTKKPMQKRFFPEGKDSKKRRYQDYRWKNFKNFEPRDMYTVVGEHVFPWLRTVTAACQSVERRLAKFDMHLGRCERQSLTGAN